MKTMKKSDYIEMLVCVINNDVIPTLLLKSEKYAKHIIVTESITPRGNMRNVTIAKDNLGVDADIVRVYESPFDGLNTSLGYTLDKLSEDDGTSFSVWEIHTSWGPYAFKWQVEIWVGHRHLGLIDQDDVSNIFWPDIPSDINE